MSTLGLEDGFDWRGGSIYWELYGSYGENRATQKKFNSHNAAKLQIAMGDPAICEATAGCVPFNFFGGQGPDGSGSITREMLDYVTYTQHDQSEQVLRNLAFNVSGGLLSMPAGEASFAAGIEYRDHEGWFRPDPIAERGETAGIPAGRTEGEFDVLELYGELSLPLIDDGTRYWELNLAARNSDYSTSGSEATHKVSTLFQPLSSLSLRASFSTGFRTPGIGELFGGAAREDFAFLDPCSDALGQFGSQAGGRETAQPPTIVANCASLGVPASFVQANPQLSATSAGNPSLSAETSQSLTLGLVWRLDVDAQWIANLTASVDYHEVEIKDAVQGRAPGDVLVACANTLDPLFCDHAPRTSNGALGVIHNQLQNIGGIEASGVDLAVSYDSPGWPIGQFRLTFNATLLERYTERSVNVDGTEAITDRTGTHTDETFQRAFPELRWVASIDWLRDRWAGTLSLRWTDGMTLDAGDEVDSALFTDLRLSYQPKFMQDAWTLSVGFNNLFDEEPPLCFPCGVIGMSQVVHDLPGRVGYMRVAYARATDR